MFELQVPVWGLTMEEAVLVSWLKKVGDTIIEGDAIAEIETDKADGDVECPVSGVIEELLVEAGSQVEPGQLIARIRTA